MNWAWIAAAFISGWLACWYVGHRLLMKLLGEGWYLDRALRNLNPDSFSRVRKAIEAEASRRNALL